MQGIKLQIARFFLVAFTGLQLLGLHAYTHDEDTIADTECSLCSLYMDFQSLDYHSPDEYSEVSITYTSISEDIFSFDYDIVSLTLSSSLKGRAPPVPYV